MNSNVASSSIAQRDTKTDRAPANKKERAMPTTPSDFTSPLPLWQQLSTTSLALSWTACTSEIVKIKSSSFGVWEGRSRFGAKAISPVSQRPCAAKWINATDVILSRTSFLVASFPVRGRVLRRLAIISTSSLAQGNCDRLKGTSSIAGSPTRSAPVLWWKSSGDRMISCKVDREGTVWILIDSLSAE